VYPSDIILDSIFAGSVATENVMDYIHRIHFSTKGRFLRFDYTLEGAEYSAVYDIRFCKFYDLVDGKKIVRENAHSPHAYIADRHGRGRKTPNGKPKMWSVKSMIRVLGMTISEWEKLGKNIFSTHDEYRACEFSYAPPAPVGRLRQQEWDSSSYHPRTRARVVAHRRTAIRDRHRRRPWSLRT